MESCRQGKENLHLCPKPGWSLGICGKAPASSALVSIQSFLQLVHAWLTWLARGARLCGTPCEKAAQGTEP